jgi:hypothetical protein
MENATKRIRKARRQGLAAYEHGLGRSTHANLSGPAMAGRDVPGEPRANARKSVMSQRKSKRQNRTATTRSRALRAMSR